MGSRVKLRNSDSDHGKPGITARWLVLPVILTIGWPIIYATIAVSAQKARCSDSVFAWGWTSIVPPPWLWILTSGCFGFLVGIALQRLGNLRTTTYLRNKAILIRHGRSPFSDEVKKYVPINITPLAYATAAVGILEFIMITFFLNDTFCVDYKNIVLKDLPWSPTVVYGLDDVTTVYSTCYFHELKSQPGYWEGGATFQLMDGRSLEIGGAPGLSPSYPFFVNLGRAFHGKAVRFDRSRLPVGCQAPDLIPIARERDSRAIPKSREQ